eukprot:239863-Chlamydomonas_euryale.AAC.1
MPPTPAAHAGGRTPMRDRPPASLPACSPAGRSGRSHVCLHAHTYGHPHARMPARPPVHACMLAQAPCNHPRLCWCRHDRNMSLRCGR